MPEEFLAEFAFYSHPDRRHRYLRDVVLGHDGNHAVLSRMMRDRGCDWSDYSDDDLWLDTDKIRDIQRRGHAIGLHTHTHPMDLGKMSRADQYEEFARNKAFLENIIGETIRIAAYPCGRYNDHSKSVLKELGIKAAFVSRPVGWTEDRLELPRVDVAAVAP